MKYKLTFLSIGLIGLLSGCDQKLSVDTMKYIFTSKDTITYDGVMMHANNIVGVAGIFGNMKIKGMEEQIKLRLRKEGRIAEKREYSFLTDKQKTEWVLPLLPYELEIDSVFYVSNFGKKDKITTLLVATATNRGMMTFSDLILLTFNEKGEKIDGKLLWPNIAYNSATSANGDTMITKTTDYFFIKDGDNYKTYKGKKIITAISTTGDYTKPEKEFSKSSLDTLTSTFTIGNDGIINPPSFSKSKSANDYFKSGNEKAKNNNFSEAIADYCKVIDLNPKFSEAYYKRGVALSRINSKKKALADYSKAIDLNPKYTNAYFSRGWTYHELENYEKALADYSKTIDLNPKDTAAYHNRGITYYDIHNYEKAIIDFSKALDLNPKEAMTFYARGCVYYKMHNDEKALVDYSKAIELNPSFADAFNNRGTVYYEMKDTKKACQDWKKASKLGSERAKEHIAQSCK